MRYQLRALLLLEVTLLRRVWQKPGLSQKLALLGKTLSGFSLGTSGALWGFFVIGSLQKFSVRAAINPEDFEISLLVLLSALCLIWVLFPLLNVLRTPPQQLPLYKLRIYPLSFGLLYHLRAVSVVLSDQNLKFYGLLLGSGVALVMGQGLNTLLPTTLHLLLFGLSLSLWSDFLTLLIGGLVIRPQIRQYLIGLILVLIPFVVMVIPFAHHLITRPQIWLQQITEIRQWPQFNAVLPFWQSFFPPGLLSQALRGLWGSQPGLLLPTAAAQLCWVLLAHRLGSIVLRDLCADPPVHSTHHPLFRHLSWPAFAQLNSRRMLMIRKDLKVLLRGTRDRLILTVGPLSIVLLGLLMPRTESTSTEFSALLITLDYLFLAALGRLNRLFSLDGLGLRFYLLAPLPLRELLLTRLSALGLLLGAEFLLSLLLWVALGHPLTAARGLFLGLSFLMLMTALMAVGSLISLRFPEALDSDSESESQQMPMRLFFPLIGLILALPGLTLGLARTTGQSPALLMAALLLMTSWSFKHLFEFAATLLEHEKLNLIR
jgi:hypothetical protein